MSILILIIPISILLSLTFVIAYIWAVRTGQFDDVETPPIRVLFDDD